jgi:hypothetical protein
MYLRKSFKLLSAALLAVCSLAPAAMGQTPAPTLSSPQDFLWSEIRHSIGNDPFVTLDPLDKSTRMPLITIHANDPSAQGAQAMALASIVIPQHVFGNLTVNVRVVDSAGNVVMPTAPTFVSDVMNAYNNALLTNRFYVGVVPANTQSANGLGVIFTREVVQFYDGDMGELFANYNAAAATVFKDVLQTTFNDIHLALAFGTQPFGALPQLLPTTVEPRSPMPQTATKPAAK